MLANASLFPNKEVIAPDAWQGLGDDRPEKLSAGEAPQCCACLPPYRLWGFVVAPVVETAQLIWLSLAGGLKSAIQRGLLLALQAIILYPKLALLC